MVRRGEEYEIFNLLQILSWLFEHIIPKDYKVKWKMERLIVILYTLFQSFSYDPNSNSFTKCISQGASCYTAFVWNYITGMLLPLYLSACCPVTWCLPLVGDTSLPSLADRYEQMWQIFWESFHGSSQPLLPSAIKTCPRQGLYLHSESRNEKAHSRANHSWTLSKHP